MSNEQSDQQSFNFAVGQVWRLRNGQTTKVSSLVEGPDPYGSYVITCSDGFYRGPSGEMFPYRYAHDRDLVEIISHPAGDEHDALTFHPLPVKDLVTVDYDGAIIRGFGVVDPAVGTVADINAAHAVMTAAAPAPTPSLRLVSSANNGVGDIASTAKGTGARFNAGKLPVDLIPLRQIGTLYLMRGLGAGLTTQQVGAARALQLIGDFQSRDAGVEALYDALGALGEPADVVRECAQVFDYGRKKYAAWNWAKGMAWSVPIGCAGRHAVWGILAGEHLDPESGYPHRGHIACNIVMLIAYAATYLEGDDRPAAGLIGWRDVREQDERRVA